MGRSVQRGHSCEIGSKSLSIGVAYGSELSESFWALRSGSGPPSVPSVISSVPLRSNLNTWWGPQSVTHMSGRRARAAHTHTHTHTHTHLVESAVGHPYAVFMVDEHAVRDDEAMVAAEAA